jgi:hypothetical protein
VSASDSHENSADCNTWLLVRRSLPAQLREVGIVDNPVMCQARRTDASIGTLPTLLHAAAIGRPRGCPCNHPISSHFFGYGSASKVVTALCPSGGIDHHGPVGDCRQ